MRIWSSDRRAPDVRRLAISLVLIGLAASFLLAVPALATNGGGKSAPTVRVKAYTNDDGRPHAADPGDVGGISPSYDRWGNRSSDDPTAAGMDTSRIDSDVARCRAVRKTREVVRVKIQNAYPGYVCTFDVVMINRVGVKLVVDGVDINVDPTLRLLTLDGPAEGDTLGKGRRLQGTYAVVVTQEAPQGGTLEFDIEVSFIERPTWATAPKCRRGRWR